MPSHAKLVLLASTLALLAVLGCGEHEDPVGAAKLDIKHQRYGDAITRIEAAPAAVRNTYDAQMILAEALFHRQDFEKSLQAYERAADLDQEKTEPLIGMARVEEARSRPQALSDAERSSMQLRVIEYCEQALAIDPQCADAYSKIGDIRWARRDFEAALDAYGKAVEAAPDDPERKLRKARLHMGLRQNDLAMQLISAALEADENLAEAFVLRAQLYGARNQREKERADLEKALEQPDAKLSIRAQATAQLASLCVRTMKLDEAKRLARQLIKMKRGIVTAYEVLGTVFIYEENWKQAYDYLKKFEDAKLPRGRMIGVLMKLALVEEKRREYEAARGHYRHIIEKLDPKHVPARLRLAVLLHRRRALEDAMKHCTEALNERPGHPEALRLIAFIHRDMARIHPAEARQHYQRAILNFGRLVRRFPTSPDIRLDLAELYLDAKQPGPALQLATKAAELQDSARARLALGRAYLSMHSAGLRARAGQKPLLEKAMENLRQARTLAPEDQRVALHLAEGYRAQKKPQEALRILKDYIGRNPKKGAGYRALAFVHERMDRLDLAVNVLEKAEATPGIEGFDPATLGRAYFLNEEFKKAIETWQKLVVAKQTGTDVNIALAVALAMDQQYEKAIAQADIIARPAEGDTPAGQDIPPGPLVAACIAIQDKQFAKAREFLQGQKHPSEKEKAVYLKFPDLCRAKGADGRRAAQRLAQGILHIQFRSFDVAVERLRDATRLLPESIVPHYMLADALFRAGRHKDGIAAYKDMFLKFPGQGYPRYRLARVVGNRRDLRDLPDAPDFRTLIDNAVDLDPGLAVAHIQMAERFLLEARRDPKKSLLRDAIKHAGEARKLDGGTKESLSVAASAHSAMTGFLQTEILKEKDSRARKVKQDEAEKTMKRTEGLLYTLRDKFPDSLAATLASVRFELNRKNFDAAAAMVQGALRQQADSTELLYWGARAAIGLSKYPKALDYLRRLLELNPNHVGAYRLRAHIYERGGNPAGVIGALANAYRASRRHRSAAVAAFALARAFLKYGRPDQAKSVYKQILDSVPSGPRDRGVEELYRTAVLGFAEALQNLPAATPDEKKANLDEAANRLKPLAEPKEGHKPDPRALYLLGQIHQEQKRPAEAIKLYDQCIRAEPKYGPPYFALALLRFGFGRDGFDHAISLYKDKIISLWPYDPAARAQLALIHLAAGDAGDTGAAVKHAEEAMELIRRRDGTSLAPSDKQVAFYQGVRILALVAARKSAEAREEIKRIRGMQIDIRESYRRLVDDCARDLTKRQAFVREQSRALFYEASGARQRATEHYKELTKAFPDNLFLLEQLARHYGAINDIGHFTETMEKMLEVAEQRGRRIDVSLHLGLYVRLIDAYLLWRNPPAGKQPVESALSTCQKALRRSPKNLALLSRLAAIHQRRDQIPDAMKALQNMTRIATRESKQWVEAKKRLAMLYYEQDRAADAVRLCDEIDKNIQADHAWLNNSAWFRAVAPRPDLKKAVDLAEKAKALRPRDPSIRDTLGWIYYRLGSYYKAELELDYAAEQRPNDANIAYHLGACKVARGKPKDGLKHLRRAIDQNRKGRPLTEKDACAKMIKDLEKQLSAAQ